MAECPDVEHRLAWADREREARRLLAPVRVRYGDGGPGDALDPVQDDEAAAVGLERLERLALDMEAQAGGFRSLDGGAVAEFYRRIVDGADIAHEETAGALLDGQLGEVCCRRRPALVADEIVDASDRLDTAMADIASRAALELDGKRAGAKR